MRCSNATCACALWPKRRDGFQLLVLRLDDVRAY